MEKDADAVLCIKLYIMQAYDSSSGHKLCVIFQNLLPPLNLKKPYFVRAFCLLIGTGDAPSLLSRSALLIQRKEKRNGTS